MSTKAWKCYRCNLTFNDESHAALHEDFGYEASCGKATLPVRASISTYPPFLLMSLRKILDTDCRTWCSKPHLCPNLTQPPSSLETPLPSHLSNLSNPRG